jgi:hypothetical protein
LPIACEADRFPVELEMPAAHLPEP